MRKLLIITRKTLLVSLLMLLTIILGTDRFIFADSSNNKDIGYLMRIDPVSVKKIEGSEEKTIIEKGNKVSNAPDVKVGDLLEFKYEFHVDENSLKQIAVGDYFLF